MALNKVKVLVFLFSLLWLSLAACDHYPFVWEALIFFDSQDCRVSSMFTNSAVMYLGLLQGGVLVFCGVHVSLAKLLTVFEITVP